MTTAQHPLTPLAVAGGAGGWTIVPVVGRTYPLSDAVDAIRHLHNGDARGKVVVTV